MKFLLWALLIYLAWRWYETKKAAEAAGTREQSASAQAADAEPADTAAAEKMVACAHCGIHLPESEAVRGQNALPYCCDAHRASHSAD